MRVQNISKRIYQHTHLDDKGNLVKIELLPGENKDIDDKIAKAWIKSGEVIEYVNPVEAKNEVAKKDEEIAKLKAEIVKLKTPASKGKK